MALGMRGHRIVSGEARELLPRGTVCWTLIARGIRRLTQQAFARVQGAPRKQSAAALVGPAAQLQRCASEGSPQIDRLRTLSTAVGMRGL